MIAFAVIIALYGSAALTTESQKHSKSILTVRCFEFIVLLFLCLKDELSHHSLTHVFLCQVKKKNLSDDSLRGWQKWFKLFAAGQTAPQHGALSPAVERWSGSLV